MALDTGAVERWYRTHARRLPWRATGVGAWGILVSEVMLQQTPVARVIPAWSAWLHRWPHPADLAAAEPGEAIRAWGTLGYPRRALALHATATACVARHGGRVPAELSALLELPGVGPYTGRAVAAFAYGRRHAVLDTNVRRVLARAGAGCQWPRHGPVTAAELAAAEALLPPSATAAVRTGQALMELGALVCRARAPACHACPLAPQSCAWLAAGRPEQRGSAPPPRPAYAGSDRQARGQLLARLRTGAPTLDRETLLGSAAPDGRGAQRARALASLLADGLVEQVATGYRLPVSGPGRGPSRPGGRRRPAADGPRGTSQVGGRRVR